MGDQPRTCGSLPGCRNCPSCGFLPAYTLQKNPDAERQMLFSQCVVAERLRLSAVRLEDAQNHVEEDLGGQHRILNRQFTGSGPLFQPTGQQHLGRTAAMLAHQGIQVRIARQFMHHHVHEVEPVEIALCVEVQPDDGGQRLFRRQMAVVAGQGKQRETVRGDDSRKRLALEGNSS